MDCPNFAPDSSSSPRAGFRLAGVGMKTIVAAIVAIAALYVADQQFAAGRYTRVAEQMIGQIRHSMGILTARHADCKDARSLEGRPTEARQRTGGRAAPTIAELQAAGATSLRAIAAGLNDQASQPRVAKASGQPCRPRGCWNGNDVRPPIIASGRAKDLGRHQWASQSSLQS